MISEAEAYLKEHFNKDYYNAVLESCAQQKVQAKENYKARLVELEKSIRELLQNFLITMKLKMRSMFTKTACLMRRFNIRKNFRKSKTEDMQLTITNII